MNERGSIPTQRPIVAGFAVMILLLVMGAVVGISHVRMLSEQLITIVSERNQKVDLATTMKNLHDARYQAILLASETTDPFESDEQRMRFSSMVQQFIAARDRFLSLPLDAEEHAAWEEVRNELPKVQAIDDQAFDLIQNDHREEARKLIQSVLKQHQIHMMKQWDTLVAMQRGNNALAVKEANVARDRATNLLLGLSAAALLVAFSVAAFVIRLSRKLEADLYEERERALVTLRSIGDAVVRFDSGGRINFMNPVAETLLGVTARESETLSASEALRLFDRDTRADLTKPLLEDTQQGSNHALPASTCLLSGHGMEYEVEGKCSPIHASGGEVMGGVLVMSDVSEARELQRKLLWHSDHDALTGLANRHAFEERLSHSLGSKRAAQLPMTMIQIGIDDLRQVSEWAGHAGSDEMLRQLAHAMGSRVRDTDVLARLGHDEFGVLLLSCPDEMAHRIARQLRDSVLGYRLTWEGNSYQVGVHLGVVHLSSENQEECLDAVAKAGQQAREIGAGGIYVHRLGPLGTADEPIAAPTSS
jgi:diguanylate cyclase (GGDEF)-like protein/PAS domain S-box-containing protein